MCVRACVNASARIYVWNPVRGADTVYVWKRDCCYVLYVDATFANAAGEDKAVLAPSPNMLVGGDSI